MKTKVSNRIDEIKVKFSVSYQAVDGENYTVNDVEAVSEYEAISKVAHDVNGDRNFGFNFEAQFSGF